MFSVRHVKGCVHCLYQLAWASLVWNSDAVKAAIYHSITEIQSVTT